MEKLILGTLITLIVMINFSVAAFAEENCSNDIQTPYEELMDSSVEDIFDQVEVHDDSQCKININFSILNYAGSSVSIFQTDLIDTRIHELKTHAECYDLAQELARQYVEIAYAETGSRFFGLQNYENVPLHIWIEWENGYYTWGGFVFNGAEGSLTTNTKDNDSEYKTGNRRFFSNGSLWPK